jgi:hypothetical protein
MFEFNKRIKWLGKQTRLAPRALPIGLCLLLMSGVATAQLEMERATITGTVTDKSGAVVSGATITATQEATNLSYTRKTNQAGEYTIGNLNPGSYSITARTSGYATYTVHNYVLEVGQAARLDIVLQVGSVSQTIAVTTAMPVLQSENASVSQVISPTAVAQLPLNGRNMTQLAVITPGVTGLNYASQNTIQSGQRPDELRPGGTTIEADGASDQTNLVLLDGIDNTEMIAQSEIVRPSVDSLQEFNIITDNADPQYRRGIGAILVTSSKSGTNALHGSVYEYARNSAVDAKNYFVQPGASIPLYRLNDLGGRVGGPIKRNKAFFFLNFEGYYEAVGGTDVESVPTLAERTGDFSGIAKIYDPLTTTASGSSFTRTEFLNDTIPIDRRDPIAYQLINAYPLPQTTSLANNIVTYPVKFSNDNRGDIRVDYQMSPTQSLFARYSIDNTQIQMPNTFNNAIGGDEGAFSGPDSAQGQQGVLAYTKVFAPNLVGDFRFGANRYSMALLSSPLTSSIWAQIPGRVPLPGLLCCGVPPAGPVAPIISPSGFGGEGNSRSEPLVRREHMWEGRSTISWIHGKHNVSFGVEVLSHLIAETISPPGQSPFGRFNFDGTFTDNPTSPKGTGNTMASEMLGYPSSTVKSLFLPGTAHVYSDEYDFFGGDDWHATKELTLNLGIHYEIDTPYAEAHDFWVNFDPATATVEIAGQNGVSKTANWVTDYGSIGPRFGFDYAIGNKTVFRGGFGAYYDPQGNFGTTIRQQEQWPYDLVYTINPGSLVPANTVSQGFLTPSEVLATGTFNMPYGNLSGIQANFRNASSQEWNLALQRQLTNSSSFTIRYVAAMHRHLAWHDPIDQPTPGPGNIQSRRPFNAQFPHTSSISFLESVGVGSYNALQLIFVQRTSHGVYFTGNYVWGHALDNTSADGGSNGPLPQNPLDRNADYASAGSDIRNRVTLYGSYELPFGAGKALFNHNSSANRFLVGGWRVNAIFVGQSGLPFTPTVSGSPSNTGGGSRADIVPGVPRYPTSQTVNEWFNPAAFATPALYTYGDAGRNSLRGPDEIDVDSAIEKKFPITEAQYVEMRIEFFNMLNHPQFDVPQANVSEGNAGTITSTSNTARQLQGSIRFVF